MSAEFGEKSDSRAAVGILMLETQFPRILGDVGNAQTWDFPVRYKIVKGATPEAIVHQDPRLLADLFIDAGRELIDLGCDGLATTCGFLTLLQDQIKDALNVPVATSSLMQIPMIRQLLPSNKRVGVITISKESLSPEHLAAANAPLDTPIVGTNKAGSFASAILNNETRMDFEGSREDLLDAARELITTYNDIGAIVLECTNMPPYAEDIQKLTGLPVFSIYTLINWFQSGLVPRQFSFN